VHWSCCCMNASVLVTGFMLQVLARLMHSSCAPALVLLGDARMLMRVTACLLWWCDGAVGGRPASPELLRAR
jgi:hypothetical protein